MRALFLMVAVLGVGACRAAVSKPDIVWLMPGHWVEDARSDCIAVDPTNTYVATCGDLDGTAKLWKTDGKFLQTLIPPTRESVTSVSFSQDGKFLLLGGLKSLVLFSVPDGRVVYQIPIKPRLINDLVKSNIVLDGIAWRDRTARALCSGDIAAIQYGSTSLIGLMDMTTGKYLGAVKPLPFAAIPEIDTPRPPKASSSIIGDDRNSVWVFATSIESRKVMAWQPANLLDREGPIPGVECAQFAIALQPTDVPSGRTSTLRFLAYRSIHVLAGSGSSLSIRAVRFLDDDKLLVFNKGCILSNAGMFDELMSKSYYGYAVFNISTNTLSRPFWAPGKHNLLSDGATNIGAYGSVSPDKRLYAYVGWRPGGRVFCDVLSTQTLRPIANRVSLGMETPGLYVPDDDDSCASSDNCPFPIALTNKSIIAFENLEPKSKTTIRQFSVTDASHLKDWLENGSAVTAIAIDHSNQYAVSCTYGKNVRLWSNKDGTVLSNWQSPAMLASLSSTGTLIAGGELTARNPRVMVFDMNGKVKTFFKLTGSKTIKDSAMVEFTASGDKLLVAGTRSDLGLRLFDATSGSELKQYEPKEPVIRFASSGSEVAAIAGERIRVWDIESGKLLQDIVSPVAEPRAIAFDSEKNVVAIGSDNGDIGLFNLSTPSEVKALKGHTGTILSLAFARNGSLLISRNNTVADPFPMRVWSTKDGSQLVAYDQETLPSCPEYALGDKIRVVDPLGSFAYGRGDGTVVFAKLPKGE